MASNLPKTKDELLEIAKKVERGEFSLLDSPGKSRKFRSLAWKIFARIKNENDEKILDVAYCKVCGTVVSYASNATTYMVRHQCFKKFIKSHQQPVSIVKEEKYIISEIHTDITTSFSNEKLKNLILNWMIRECQTFDLFHSEGLKAIFNELFVLGSKFGENINLENLLPTPSEARKTLSEMYQECFEQVYAEIGLIEEDGLGLTSDIWTDSFTKQKYIVVTAHYMQSGDLKTRLLGLMEYENEQNTNQDVLNKIKQILTDFNCKLSKKTIIVADFADTLFPDTTEDLHSLPCLSRLLSDVILQSIEQVPEVKEIVNACSSLINCLIKLEEETLLNDILTNSHCHPWQKTYNMLSGIADKWCDIEEVLRNLNEKSLILSINIANLKAVVKALQPFEEAIQTLENDSSPTLHLVIVYLHELKKSCDTSLSEFEDLNLIKELKGKLRIQLEKIMTQDVKTLHKIALFLYPPTNKLLQFNEAEKLIIENECLQLMQNYKPEQKSNEKQNVDTVTTPSSAKKRKSIFSDFIASNDKHNASSDHFSREIQLYKLFDADYDDDFDVLNWWQIHRESFPYLYKLSCAVLATPTTCAPSKRILMAGNNLLTNKSNNIAKGVELQKTLFLNANVEQDELDY